MIAAAIERLRVGSLRDGLASLVPGPRLRRILIVVVAVVAVLAAGYLLWLRNSSLVQVESVTVTGLTGQDAERARTALEGAARQSTTLRVDEDAISRAAASFPTIRAVQVEPDFPNEMRIHVVEHRPAALLVGAGKRIPVAGDGSLLSGLPVKGSLPTIELSGAAPVRQLGPGAALDAARIAGAAPAALTPRLEEIEREGRRGIVVRIEGGPDLIFGNPTRVVAKWAAATRVLADRDATGAEYVDVRIPERPVAGGLPVQTMAPLAPAGALDPAPPPAPGSFETAPGAADAAAGAPATAGEGGTPSTPGVQLQQAQPEPDTGAPSPDAPAATPTDRAGGGAAPNPQP